MKANSLLAAALAVVLSLFALSAGPALAKGAVVAINASFLPGTIIVRTNERRLYLVIGGGQAIAYPVGVGRAGKQWSGESYIDGMYTRPAWSPPAVVRHDHPNLPNVVPGGSPHNPMGVAAMSLAGGEYAIHGTNQPGSIGHFVSYGCIRMYNEDISDLFGRVTIGTRVVVQ
jgi:lipoprotein-anchoring transpeptidase ErfK/SrfK